MLALRSCPCSQEEVFLDTYQERRVIEETTGFYEKMFFESMIQKISTSASQSNYPSKSGQQKQALHAAAISVSVEWVQYAQLQEAAFLCRPFCSWVLCKDSSSLWRCGWKWTLESLVDSPSEYNFQVDEAYQSSRVSL